MARIRTIKPEIVQSESLGRVSREARLCFVLLWTQADDAGRLRANSRLLASLLYPYDDDAANLMDDWLDELEAEGCVRRYVVNGNTYLDIPNWRDHQKIDHAKDSKLPEYSEAVAKRREDSREERRPSRQISQDQGRDQGREGTKERAADAAREFEAFWNCYPRKQGKGAAERAFKQAVSQTSLPDLLAALERQKPNWTDPKFTPMPATWLNGKRWLDEIPGTAEAKRGRTPEELYDVRKASYYASHCAYWDDRWGLRPPKPEAA